MNRHKRLRHERRFKTIKFKYFYDFKNEVFKNLLKPTYLNDRYGY